ncbi:hypothetical protein THTE_2800 [Thermogutta terrifontis]|uniref:Uncharacterized protein n=1 Tax=Thermogutta terrifontis TaxID=1331910 RepID=A0A286RHI3_9BACT|nr:hypothetical protein THTE_2800 [Thermogutta terrifontis]
MPTLAEDLIRVAYDLGSGGLTNGAGWSFHTCSAQQKF